MNNNYELTIITSNYNQEEHLSETIDSILAQKVNFPYRVIITDDYSCRDRSKEVIQQYVERFKNIEAFLADENGGYLTNILRAISKTKTKYFCLLDADDYWTDECFIQRAYDFLEHHPEYSIYESNVEVMDEEGIQASHPFVSHKFKSGTYKKDDLLNNLPVPITQTTGMILRNSIFSHGIPDIMKNAIGTRSERSFEGDTGRFIMHLKYGVAYYDNRTIGVYRVTKNGIWSSLSEAKKHIITAHLFVDFYDVYETNAGFFANHAYKELQRYLIIKQKELTTLSWQESLIDEYERLMVEDVYRFCREYEYEIIKQDGWIDKLKQIKRVIKA